MALPRERPSNMTSAVTLAAFVGKPYRPKHLEVPAQPAQQLQQRVVNRLHLRLRPAVLAAVDLRDRLPLVPATDRELQRVAQPRDRRLASQLRQVPQTGACVLGRGVPGTFGGSWLALHDGAGV